MRQYNIFDGESDYAGFAKAAYKSQGVSNQLLTQMLWIDNR